MFLKLARPKSTKYSLFAHHTMPGTKNTPAYLDWIQLDYQNERLREIERNDCVVLDYPADDLEHPERPVDKKENYIKRCGYSRGYFGN